MDQADYSKNRTKLPPSLGGTPHKKKGKSTPHAWLPPSLGGAPWFIERSCAVGGRYPPGYRRLWAEPPLVHRTKFPPLGGGTPLVPPLGGGTLVTCVAHEYRLVLIRIAGDDEFGFIINAALAFAAKPEFVFIPFG